MAGERRRRVRRRELTTSDPKEMLIPLALHGDERLLAH